MTALPRTQRGPALAPFHRPAQSPSSDSGSPFTVPCIQADALSSLELPPRSTEAANACTSAPSGSETSVTPKGLRGPAVDPEPNSFLSQRMEGPHGVRCDCLRERDAIRPNRLQKGSALSS